MSEVNIGPTLADIIGEINSRDPIVVQEPIQKESPQDDAFREQYCQGVGIPTELCKEATVDLTTVTVERVEEYSNGLYVIRIRVQDTSGKPVLPYSIGYTDRTGQLIGAFSNAQSLVEAKYIELLVDDTTAPTVENIVFIQAVSLITQVHLPIIGAQTSTEQYQQYREARRNSGAGNISQRASDN